MIRILVTSAGGAGSNNLVGSLKLSSLKNDVYLIGTHCDPYELACANTDVRILVPKAKEAEAYLASLESVVEDERVDMIIPNSDIEAGLISEHRGRIRARLFLPDAQSIATAQDKYELFRALKQHGIPVAETFDIADLDDIEKKLHTLPDHGRFWIRVRTGAGSVAATWVNTAAQARSWIRLWQELQGLKTEQFTVSEFLPGNDYAVHTIWHDGTLLNAKICRRMSYFMGEMRLSGMASTPRIAKTVDNRAAVDTCVKAIELIARSYGSRPNGVYELDMKENAQGIACITEINIGRFPMISPIFDRTGKYNSVELYVRCAMGMPYESGTDPYDFEPDVYMLRGLERDATLCRAHELEALEQRSAYGTEDLVFERKP